MIAACMAAVVTCALPTGAFAAQRAPFGEQSEPRAKAEPADLAPMILPLDPDRVEFALLPGVSANSDTGVGFGALGALAGFESDYDPFRWRLEAFVFLTLKEAPDGTIEDPFHYYYLRYDFPDAAGDWLRLSGELSFKRFSTTGYYGIGNAAPELRPWESLDESQDPDGYTRARRYNQYDRIFPKADLNARMRVLDDVEVFSGVGFTYNWFNEYPGSRLTEDRDGKRGEYVRSLLVGATEHGVVSGLTGVLYDTRDHETTPSSGMLHEVSAAVGAGIGAPFLYGRANVTARFYQSIYEEYLVFAGRLMGDVLFGEPPFYELARAGGLTIRDAPGGAEGVRGVPAQRYHGKIKAIGNVELRSKLWWFELFGQRLNLGAAAFFDAGRVWTDWQEHPELDALDLGLKYGAGGGVRFQWGETFIARVDGAWSPDGVGFYVEAYHIF